MPDLINIRIDLQELQNKKVAILHGIDADSAGLCAVGWFEDTLCPEDSVGAVVLFEPLICRIAGPDRPNERGDQRPQGMQVVTPTNGVPEYSEFNTYYKVDVFEGVTAFAAQYFSTLAVARRFVPLYSNPSWVFTGAASTSNRQDNGPRSDK